MINNNIMINNSNEQLCKSLVVFKKIPIDFDKTTNSKDKSKATAFRLSCKHFFLTYSRCNLDLNDVFKQLETALNTYGIKDYLIVKEKHSEDEDSSKTAYKNESTEYHIHVYLNTLRKANITNAERLHLKSGGAVFKGNYQSSKKPLDTLNYCLKHNPDASKGEIIYSKDIGLRISKNGTIQCFETMIIQMAKMGNVEEAMAKLEIERPKDFLKNHMRIEKSLRDLRMKSLGAVSKYTALDFELPTDLENAIDISIKENKTLIVSGSPGAGKSKYFEFRLLDKNVLIVNNVDALRFFRAGYHLTILYDDCDFSKCSREDLIKLLDSSDGTTHSIKHGTVSIPPNIPRYVLTNKTLEGLLGFLAEDKAIKRRLKFYNLPDGMNLFALLSGKNVPIQTPEVIYIDNFTEKID